MVDCTSLPSNSVEKIFKYPVTKPSLRSFLGVEKRTNTYPVKKGMTGKRLGTIRKEGG